MASKKFYPGDKVIFEHWSTNALITGTVMKSYAALGCVYLWIKDSEGTIYQPDEERCKLITPENPTL